MKLLELWRKATGLFRRRDDSRALLAALPDPTVITDAAYNVAAWNRAFTERCGSMAGLIGGTPLAHLMRSWVSQGLMEEEALPNAMAALKAGDDCTYAALLAGEHYRFRQTRLPSGGLMLTLADNSVAYRLAQALARTEAHCAALFEHAPAAVVMSSNVDGRVVRANTRAQRQLGVTDDADPRELVAQDFYANPDERADIEAHLRRSGEVHDRVVKLRRQDGGALWASLSARKVRLGESSFVISILSDVTRTRSEAERARTDLQRLEQLIELLPVAILMTRSGDGMVLLNNRKARALISGSPDISLAGRPVPDFFADREERSRFMSDIAFFGRADNHSLRLHMPGLAETCWFEVSATSVDHEGQPAVLMALHDIHERARLGEALQTARAEAEQAQRRLREAQVELEELSSVDRLTGAMNRRHFEEMARREIGRARRHTQPLAFLLLDIDHFRHLNQDYGRSAGDVVLQELAALVAGRLRVSDMLARWGGEEFAILAPATTMEEAHSLAEKLRDKVVSHAFPDVGQVSISIGITVLRYRDTLDTLLLRADEAMQRAKALGRNQVCTASNA